MNYWLHRISYCNYLAYPLLGLGYLSIGWSNLSDWDFLNNVRKGDKNAALSHIEGHMEKECKMDFSRNKFSLLNFVYEMKKGDTVIVPSGGEFCIYIIIGEHAIPIGELIIPPDTKAWGNKAISVGKDKLLHVNGQEKAEDLGFALQVEALDTPIARAKYADAELTVRMKIRSTDACATGLKTEACATGLRTDACATDLKDNKGKAAESLCDKKPLSMATNTLEKLIA